MSDVISPVHGNDPSKWPYPYNPATGPLPEPLQSMINGSNNTYLQPDGFSQYLQPDGISKYLQP